MQTVVMSAKFHKADVHLIEKAAKLRGEDKSSLFRRAVFLEIARLGLLTEERKRVLEIQEGEES